MAQSMYNVLVCCYFIISHLRHILIVHCRFWWRWSRWERTSFVRKWR